jgi:uncharacterized protein
LSTYLDASVLVSLFTNDKFSRRADQILRGRQTAPVVSDFGAAEFASVISLKTRMHTVTKQEASGIFTTFDGWVSRTANTVDISPTDIRNAEGMLRRLDLVLRAPDAIHIAITQRIGAELVTFDRHMADCARALRVPVAAI